MTTSGPPALYDGIVRHQRPGGYGFTQHVRMVHVDADGFDALCALHPLWSARRRAPVELRRDDYLGAGEGSLGGAVRALVGDHLGTAPHGPVTVLTHPRTWGWLFNPISCYFCWNHDGTQVEAAVFEVTNTPWHERTHYVVGPPGRHDVDKTLHVSPFLPADLTYRIRYTVPDATCSLAFTVTDHAGEVRLVATLAAGRVRADRRALGSVVWRPWRGTLGVSAGIYRRAAALRLRGATFHPHPRRRSGSALEESAGG